VMSLKRIMMDFALSPETKSIAGNLYVLLQSTNPTNPIFTERASNFIHRPTRHEFSVFSERGVSSLTSAKTITFETCGNINKGVLETKLVKVAGVISFIIDSERNLVTIRSSNPSSQLLGVFKSIGVPARIQQSETNQDAGYLPEPNETQTSSWLSSIVSWVPTSFSSHSESNSKTFLSRLFSIG